MKKLMALVAFVGLVIGAAGCGDCGCHSGCSFNDREASPRAVSPVAVND